VFSRVHSGILAASVQSYVNLDAYELLDQFAMIGEGSRLSSGSTDIVTTVSPMLRLSGWLARLGAERRRSSGQLTKTAKCLYVKLYAIDVRFAGQHA